MSNILSQYSKVNSDSVSQLACELSIEVSDGYNENFNGNIGARVDFDGFYPCLMSDVSESIFGDKVVVTSVIDSDIDSFKEAIEALWLAWIDAKQNA